MITGWSPIHLRTKLKELYWKADQPAALVSAFWEDTLRYLYLPRLKDHDVLFRAILDGAGSRDFFGTAYGQTDDKYDGFKFGDKDIQIYDTLLLIEPNAAKLYQDVQATAIKPVTTAGGNETTRPGTGTSGGNTSESAKTDSGARPAVASAPRSFHAPSSTPSNVRQASSQTSCSSHCFSRRQHVAGVGYSSGTDRQAAPIHKYPQNALKAGPARRP